MNEKSTKKLEEVWESNGKPVLIWNLNPKGTKFEMKDYHIACIRHLKKITPDLLLKESQEIITELMYLDPAREGVWTDPPKTEKV